MLHGLLSLSDGLWWHAGALTSFYSFSIRAFSHNFFLFTQEEERERRDNYVPEVSEIAVEKIKVDPDTKAMLDMIGTVPQNVEVVPFTRPGRGRDRRPRAPART